MIRAALLCLALVAVATVPGTPWSGADFTAGTASPGNTFAAAADFNTVAVAMTDPGTPLEGAVPLQATASSERGIASVRFESSPAGASTWTTACQATSAPYTCDWSTADVADGLRDVRAVATDAAGYVRISAVIGSRRVDNTAPAVSIPALGTVRGTVDIPVTASDAGTGVASVTVQILLGGTWTDACTDTAAPWACTGLDSTTVADGAYQARAIAVDGAGRGTTSAAVSVRIDNTAPSVATLADPGAYLRGSVNLSGTAADAGSGVTSWTVQYRSGAGAWTAACSDTTAPYNCSWATSGVTDGTYDLRAVAVDAAGNSTMSTVLAGRRVDNTAPAGASIATTNAGTAGRIDSGDQLTLAYSEQVAPASLLSGWTGTSRAITVRVVNSAGNDRMEFLSGATRVNLVAAATDLELGANFVSATTSLSATMVQTGAGVVIQFTQGTSSGSATAGQLKWIPSSAATDLAGNAALTTQVTEAGASDRDF